MNCPYCGNNILQRNDFKSIWLGNENGTGKRYTIPWSEYFCLTCQNYFWWLKKYGIIVDYSEKIFSGDNDNIEPKL